MKMQSALLLALPLAALCFPPGALALNYSGRQGNKATFETLEEARVNGPASLTALPANRGRNFKSHPALDGFPKNAGFVYRSANLYGGRAARSNTNILVYTDKAFADKDAALAYLKGLGLVEIIDQAVGSLVLATPANPAAGFGVADQKGYYALQTAILSLRASERVNNVTSTYAEGDYFGGFGFLYVVGVDGGATFVNNYVAATFDFSSRLAGALLINGKMDPDRKVASLLPAYLVNPTAAVEEKYKTANQTNAVRAEGAAATYYNQTLPLQRVTVAKGAVDAATAVKQAYTELFSRTMRIPVVRQGLLTAGTPYQGYSFDQAPYSLAARNVAVNGVTPGGIALFPRQQDTLAAFKTPAGEYLQTWTEYVPKEVLDGKAAPGSVPLVLALHGGGDDPEAFAEECGWLELAHQKRFIMVAPEHQALDNTPAMGEGLQALAQYMMKTYPAIDPSRIYASGYSMGGIATLSISTSHPRLLAAAVNMAGAVYTYTKEMDQQFQSTELPMMFLTSEYDSTNNIKWDDGSLTASVQNLLNKFLTYNKMEPVTFDFAARPKHGFAPDGWSEQLLNGEHRSFVWYRVNRQKVPMVALSYTSDLIHALYPGYAGVAWDYLSKFSRDQKTGAVQYHSERK